MSDLALDPDDRLSSLEDRLAALEAALEMMPKPEGMLARDTKEHTIYVVVLDRIPVGAFTRLDAARQFIDLHSDEMVDPKWMFSVTCMELHGGRK